MKRVPRTDRTPHTSPTESLWLNEAKCVRPRQKISLIDRPHLMDRLDAASPLKLCLILAPAGFGKTTLLANWWERLADDSVKVAWLSLDEDDSDLRHFLSYLIFSMKMAGVGMGDLAAAAEEGLAGLSPATCLSRLSQCIADERKRVVLVLDDYHRIQSSEVDMMLNRLLSAGLDNFTLFLSSRLSPELIIPQLMASGQAERIDADALRLSRDECEALFDGHMSDSDLTFVCEKTEGWAIAVQLARLLVGGTEQPFRDQFRGTGPYLASYLTNQVLNELPGDLSEFMIRTSVLDRFDDQLANAVTERRDSWAMLQRLRPLQSLLIPLDDQQEWFRYHHLMADYLREQLWVRYPDQVSALHSRASIWFQEAGNLTNAVRYASLAGDFGRCAELIEAAGGWELILYGGIGHLRDLLRPFPDSELSRHPRILVAKAYLSIKDGDLKAARALMQLARAHPSAEDGDIARGLGRDLFNIGLLLDDYESSRPTTPDAFVNLLETRSRISTNDHLTRGIVECALAGASFSVGDLSASQQFAKEGDRSMRRANSSLGFNYMMLHSGIPALHAGRLTEANSFFTEALRHARNNVGRDNGLQALAQLLTEVVMFLTDRWDDEALTRFNSAREHVERYDGWYEVYAWAFEVAVTDAMARSDFDLATSIIAVTRNAAEDRNADRLADHTEAFRLLLLIEQGLMQEAQIAATGLEQRYPLKCWEERRFLWRSYVDVGLALAKSHSKSNFQLALKYAQDVTQCCTAIGAKLPAIRGLIMIAILRDQAGQRAEALNTLIEAVKIAAPESIFKPFLTTPEITPLLYSSRKRLRHDEHNDIENFISETLRRSVSIKGNVDYCLEGGGFSVREREVVAELVRGSSNKIIARHLDLSEHTVKFHLRNIFAKLRVRRRVDAISTLLDQLKE